jgi:perosamine synthetase
MTSVESAITKRTKALLPVHVFGRPCDLSRLRELAEAHKLALVEDACEALGSTYQGRHVGGFGLAGTLGFAPNKQITTAEGGALLTDRDDIADFARSMRRQGRSANLAANEYAHAGYNYRLSDVHAALGLAQLRRLDTLLRAREAAVELYRRHLARVEGLTLPEPDREGSRTSWFVWVVLVDKALAGDGRGRILANLNRRGIGAAHYFPALHLQPFLRQSPSNREGAFPNAEEIAARAIALPFFPGITEDQVLTVRDCLVEELQSAKSLGRSV